MAFRGNLEDDGETANQDEHDNPDVEGHAIRSGRAAGVPDRSHTDTAVEDHDVEGHGFRGGRAVGEPS